MNYLTYKFDVVENEGTRMIHSLNASVAFNRSPCEEGDQLCNFDIWVDFPDEKGNWAGNPELDSFDEKTAIALRDFLVFCFPLK